MGKNLGWGWGGSRISRVADQTVSSKMGVGGEKQSLVSDGLVQIPAALLAKCVTLSKLLDLAKPQFSHL